MRRQSTLFLLCLVLLPACSETQSDGSSQTLQPIAGDMSSEQPSAGSKAHNGPFGLAMGQPLGELSLADEEGDPTQARLLASVPRPMPELETYAVVAYPETGVCEIRSVSQTFESDAYGNNVKAAMDTLADALDSKYGKHRKLNQCSDYNCEFFQQNLTDGSQVYSYTWSAESGAKLPTNIREVALAAMSGQFNGTFYRLDYTSADTKACKAAERKAKAAAL